MDSALRAWQRGGVNDVERATGTDGDANAYYSAWGARASVHSLSSSVATSTALSYFVTTGPVLVHDPAGRVASRRAEAVEAGGIRRRVRVAFWGSAVDWRYAGTRPSQHFLGERRRHAWASAANDLPPMSTPGKQLRFSEPEEPWCWTCR